MSYFVHYVIGSEMCNVTGTRTPCFNGTCEGDTQELCEYNCNRLGCCWQGEKCYYPIQGMQHFNMEQNILCPYLLELYLQIVIW